jgi:hypothetical protein
MQPLGGDAMADNSFEIPQTLRDLSEQNLKQAHTAYEQLTDFVTNAMDAWMGAMPANPMTAGFKDVQGRAMQIAMENAESAFTFAAKICNAPTPEDIVTLQTRFGQERIQVFITQTQQLFGLFGEALQNSDRGAMGVSMKALPSNLSPSNLMTDFKDVRNCAVAMAKKNAEAAASLVEKIARAQNFQELLTLQFSFIQEHMQSYTTQAEELQKLIEEALRQSPREA